MKIKLDENLPFRLATLLKDLGHDTHTVNEERLIGHHNRGERGLSPIPELSAANRPSPPAIMGALCLVGRRRPRLLRSPGVS